MKSGQVRRFLISVLTLDVVSREPLGAGVLTVAGRYAFREGVLRQGGGEERASEEPLLPALPSATLAVKDTSSGDSGLLEVGTGSSAAAGDRPEFNKDIGPGSDDLNKETAIRINDHHLPFSYECIVALLWVTMVASLPLCVIWSEGKNITKTQIAMFCVMWVAFFGGIVLFTTVIYFQSSHFSTIRRLTLVEAVYLMSQILTTVGYGDITPALPRGQVFVGLYVVFSILVIANVFGEVVELITDRVEQRAAKLKEYMTRARGAAENALTRTLSSQEQHAKFFHNAEPPPLEFARMLYTTLLYIGFVLMGVLFFHLYPGEGKTWFEGVYMSVITLSTVGFGAITPTTEAGKAFAAFWMLLGSTSMVALVGAFTDLHLQMKSQEKWDAKLVKADQVRFFKCLPDKTDKLTFLKKSLVHNKYVSEDVVENILSFFDTLGPDMNSNLTRETLDTYTSSDFAVTAGGVVKVEPDQI